MFHATGNYVIQQVLTCGGEDHQSAILKTLTKTESVLRFSKHKDASNVIEAVLVHGEAHHKKEILDELLKVSGVNCILWTSSKFDAEHISPLLRARFPVFQGHERRRRRILLRNRTIERFNRQLRCEQGP